MEQQCLFEIHISILLVFLVLSLSLFASIFLEWQGQCYIWIISGYCRAKHQFFLTENVADTGLFVETFFHLTFSFLATHLPQPWLPP